uniref:N-acetylmuramoyl-L-alanine amidase n=2 Tax=Candidatus Bipolaricaulota TaxID=67810 RepID=H5SML9_9BACT|nr:N-acetylmuramoyl-L-alanine amidase [uncultured Acetothermia bacterium]BAL59787.1 N-acetylmuramoyl-L-alanine amidase [Candidatus Acetothermum autotrophicum]
MGVSQPGTLTVVIDAGHGGDDTGGIGVDNVTEKAIVLQIAHLIALESVNSPKIKILLTRSADQYLAPGERLARARGAQAFLSLHLNFSYDPRMRGITAVVPDKADPHTHALADALRARLISATKSPDLGTQTAPLWLRRLPIPAVQLNVGFITNPQEARQLAQLAYQKRIAQAIVAALEEFF